MAHRRKVSSLPARSFAGIPRIVMESDDFKNLSGNSVKLLLSLAYQYNGKNNGDLTTAWSVMSEKHGFKSPGVLDRAKKQLLKKNLIMQTRPGYFQNPGGRCALYAVTWLSIDECKSKCLEVKPTTVPPRKFSMEKNAIPNTESVQGSIPNQYRQATN